MGYIFQIFFWGAGSGWRRRRGGCNCNIIANMTFVFEGGGGGSGGKLGVRVYLRVEICTGKYVLENVFL